MKGASHLRTAAFVAAVAYLLVLGFLLRHLHHQGDQPAQSLTLQHLSAAATAGDETLKVIVHGSGFDAQTRASLSLDTGNRRLVRSEIPLWGKLNDAVVVGETLLVAHNFRGIMSFDVSDPLRPRLLDTLPISGTPLKLAVSGDYAYVCARHEGLHVVAISDPGRLELAATVASPGLAIDIALGEERGIVANAALGLQSFDLSDPLTPRPLSTLELPGHPVGLAQSGTTLFVASTRGGLHVVDASDPRAMRLIASLPTEGAAMGVSVRQERAYVATLNGGVLVVDISDPRSPRLVTSALALQATFVAAKDDRAYVTTTGEDVRIYDLRDPDALVLLGTIEIPGFARSVAAAGSLLFVPTSRGGLQVVDASDPLAPQAIGTLTIDNFVPDMLLDAGRVVVATSTSEILLVDVSGPQPALISAAHAPATVLRLAVCRGRIYAALRGGGIAVFAKEGDALRHLHTIATDAPVAALAVSGSALYAASANQVFIFDASASDGPLHTVHLDRAPKTLAVDKGRLYIGAEEGTFVVLDLRRPLAPKILGKAQLPWHMRKFSMMAEMIVREGTAYVADGRNGLVVVDLREPRRARVVGSVQFARIVNRITLDGEWLYASDGQDGLYQVDVRNPARPQITALIANGIQSRGIALGDGTIVFATKRGDLRRLPLPAEIEQIRLIDPTRLALSLPRPEFPGAYTLRVFSAHRSAELHGALVIE